MMVEMADFSCVTTVQRRVNVGLMEEISCRKGYSAATAVNATVLYDHMVESSRFPPLILAYVCLMLSSKVAEVHFMTAQQVAHALHMTARKVTEYEALLFKQLDANVVRVGELVRGIVVHKSRGHRKESSPTSILMDPDLSAGSDNEEEVTAEVEVQTRTMRDVMQDVLGKTKYIELEDGFMAELHARTTDTLALQRLEQGSQPWRSQRSDRVGGSTIGAWYGHNPYQSWRAAIKQRLHGSSFAPNFAMRRGTALEPRAARMLVEYVQRQYPDAEVELREYGLCVPDDRLFHMFNYSPDGVLFITFPDRPPLVFLIELKAPMRGPYKNPSVPPQYYCQMQMGLLIMPMVLGVTMTECYFAQILEPSPDEFTLDVQMVPYDRHFATSMINAVRQRWRTEYVPRVLGKREGLISQPSIDLSVDLDPGVPAPPRTIRTLSMYKRVRLPPK
jgi:hypothetical protein